MQNKFKVGDRVIILSTQREGIVSFSGNCVYDVKFNIAGCNHYWCVREEDLRLVENALQKLKRRYGKV